MPGERCDLEEVASRYLETPSLVLSVRTLAGLQDQHKAHVFLCRKRATKNFKNSSLHSLVHPGITSNGWPIATIDTKGMTDGYLVLEVVCSHRYETPSLVLSVRTLTDLERSDPHGSSTDNSMHMRFSADEHTTVFLQELSEGTWCRMICRSPVQQYQGV